MIGKIRYADGRNYVCDECKNEVKRFKNYDEARRAGWAISYFRDKCYCPNCAELHRHAGKAFGGVKNINVN